NGSSPCPCSRTAKRGTKEGGASLVFVFGSPMPAGTEPAISLELFVEAPDDESRRGEPVSCGLPWPRGRLFDPGDLHLDDAEGRPVVLQTRALDRWADGSIRWLLVDWLADATGRTRYRLHTATTAVTRPE